MTTTPDNKIATAGKARFEASKALIAAHRDEYRQLLGDRREQLGLPRESATSREVTLAKRIDRYEQRLAAARSELDQLNGGGA